MKIVEYAENNDMKVDLKKTKIVASYPFKTIDFVPEVTMQGQMLEVVEKFKILGLIITSDLSWEANTEYIVQKANKRLWIIRWLKALGVNCEDL